MNNVLQVQEIPLSVWGGAVPEMSATDLPAGGSPYNQDVDYSIGKVFTRPGCISVFSFTGTEEGPYNPTIGQNYGTGSPPSGTAWANPSNITVGNPATYATVTVPVGGSVVVGEITNTRSRRCAGRTVTVPVGGSSDELQALAYNIAVPAGSTIQGVQVNVTGKENATNNFSLTCFPQSLGAELLTNPGFETGDFTGWVTHQAMQIVTSPVHSGTYAAGTVNASGSTTSTLIQETYSGTTGQIIRMSYWAQYVPGNPGPHLGALEADFANGTAGTALPVHPSMENTWKEFVLHGIWNSSSNPEGPWFPFGLTNSSYPWTVDDVSFKLVTQGYISTTTSTTYNQSAASSVEFWFTTATTDGGVFVSHCGSKTATTSETVNNFSVFMATDGKLGVFQGFNGSNNNNGSQTLGTPVGYNDGNLHQCVVTLGASSTLTIPITAMSWINVRSVANSPNTSQFTCTSTTGLAVGMIINVPSFTVNGHGVSAFTAAITGIQSSTLFSIDQDFGASYVGSFSTINATGAVRALDIYVDGSLVQSTVVGAASSNSGYWRMMSAPVVCSSYSNPQSPWAAGTGFTFANESASSGLDGIESFSSAPVYINACISHVSVWTSTALTGTQATNHYNALKGAGGSQTNYESVVTADAPTYFWYLNETSGTTATDYIAGNNGTYVGTVTLGGTYPIGSSSGSIAGSLLTITPANPVAGAESDTFTLGLTNSTVSFGGPTDLWGMPTWNTAAAITAATFGFQIQATTPTALNAVQFEISEVQVDVWYAAAGNPFLYVKTYEQQDGTILTLALDDTGIFWQENVETNPYILTQFYNAIEPNTYAKSFTLFDREFIALSNLTNATDMPRSYDGTNVDRLSQVGPGAAPSMGSTSTSIAISSITQGVQVSIPNAQWTSGPNSTTPGAVIIPYSQDPNFTTGGNLTNPTLQVGTVVYLNFTNADFSSANGTYFVTSVGSAYGMEDGDGTLFYYFTVQAPSTHQYNVHGGSAVGTYQPTLATMTLATPVNTLDVGTQFDVTGVTPGAWDSTWSVISTLNGAQLNINETSLTGDAALYNYTLVSGVAPTVGELVTVIGCVNGPVVNGQSVFNVASAAITSTGTNSFTIFPVNAANVLPGAEAGKAIVSGTEYTFDPGLGLVGSITDPIFGAGGTGSLVQSGGLGAGLRSAVVIFLTRNDYLTQPSAPIVFELTANASAITATNIPLGPPNVIARIIAFTGASGSQYYWIPIPVTVTSLGVPTTYSATIINDNTTTSATFNFTDAILLSSNEIDISGDNLFQQVELGSSLGVIAYSDRVFAWGEQNKVQNFVNMTFDGGYLAVTSTTAIQPLGWTVVGAGGSLVASPLFGNSYYIQNASGTTQAVYGMITQSAYEDYNNVPIINPQTEYGARVTCSCPSQIGSGNLVVDLYSPGFNLVYGSYAIPLASLGAGMSINTGNLLTSEFVTEAALPPDLLLRVWANAIPNGGDVMIDRIEPYDLSKPVLTTQFRASYVDNPEAFDGITGNCGPNQDAKPILGAAVLFDSLYALKKGSMYSTSDPGTSEPSTWGWKTVSPTIGTVGIHAYDYGEDWLVIGDRSGLYVFGGGPIPKVSQEIQPVWKLITNMETMVVRNDTVNRRITVQCCIPTPNQYMPTMPSNPAPATPNVMLMMNYREVDSVYELANAKPLHQTYMGTIKAFDMSRKWSYWNIPSPYADFCERPDGTEQLLICAQNYPKIYELGDTQYSDDGVAINSWYTTFGFPGVEGAQAMQLGNHELELCYGTMTVVGSGTFNINEAPNSPNNPNAQTILPLTLANIPPLGDYELPFNDIGERFFLTVGTFAVGDHFTLSKMVMTIKTCPWFPVKGVGF